jgi:hypothetical protein
MTAKIALRMPPAQPVSLQINVAPSDAEFLGRSLPQQLALLGGAVREVTISLDRQGRGPGAPTREDVEAVDDILTRASAGHPHVRVVAIERDASASRDIGRALGWNFDIPLHDHAGGPWLHYAHGLANASEDVVLHLDADMMLVGNGAEWVRQGVQALRSRPDLFCVNPSFGLPAASLSVRTQIDNVLGMPGGSIGRRDPQGWRWRHMSTRAFLVDRRSLRDLRPFAYAGSRVRHRRPHGVAPFEVAVTALMRRTRRSRLDLILQEHPLVTVHQTRRTERLIQHWDTAIARVERGTLHHTTAGHSDLDEGQLLDAAPVPPLDALSLGRAALAWARAPRAVPASGDYTS